MFSFFLKLFLLNGAIILDKFELLNGIIYLIDEYPRYFDKSILGLLQQNDIAGLSQNLKYAFYIEFLDAS
jgi:hypothetical protein